MDDPREGHRHLTFSKGPDTDFLLWESCFSQMQDLGNWNALFPECLGAGWVLLAQKGIFPEF